MVFCIVGLVVFGILGIFSAKYRELAKEAFACAFNMVRLRPCTTGFDTKMKVKLSTKLSSVNPFLGKTLFKHFQLFSWLMVLLTVVSLFWVGSGFYNYLQFGNCNGPNSTEFCAFAPETYGNIFAFYTNRPEMVKPIVLEGGNELGPVDAPVQMLEVGCFSCPFTRQVEPWVEKILSDYNGRIHFSFKYLPIPSHAYSHVAAQSAECAKDQGKYWEYHHALFGLAAECGVSTAPEHFIPKALSIARDLNLDVNRFEACVQSGEKAPIVDIQKHEAVSAGVYGTPTFFINGKVLVSPKTEDELRQAVESALNQGK